MLAAIVIYALAKLIERKDKYSPQDFDKYLKLFIHTIDDSIECVSNDSCDEFRGHISSMLKESEKLPKEFIAEDGLYITPACRQYLEPLIQGEAYPPYKNGLPQYVKLKKQCVKKKQVSLATAVNG